MCGRVAKRRGCFSADIARVKRGHTQRIYWHEIIRAGESALCACDIAKGTLAGHSCARSACRTGLSAPSTVTVRRYGSGVHRAKSRLGEFSPRAHSANRGGVGRALPSHEPGKHSALSLAMPHVPAGAGRQSRGATLSITRRESQATLSLSPLGGGGRIFSFKFGGGGAILWEWNLPRSIGAGWRPRRQAICIWAMRGRFGRRRNGRAPGAGH